MATMVEVRAILDPDEPDYDRIVELGAGAIEHLETLIDGGDEMLASKAAYAASLLPDERAADLVHACASSDRAVLRVAAAAGLKNLKPKAAAELAAKLASDPDVGVSKTAISAAQAHPDADVATAISSDASPGAMPDSDNDSIMPDNPDSAPETGLMPGESDESGESNRSADETMSDQRSQSSGSGLMPGESEAAPDSAKTGLMPGE